MPPQKDSCLANEQLQFVGLKQTAKAQDLDRTEPALVANVRAKLKNISADIEIEKKRLKTSQLIGAASAPNSGIRALESEAAKYERHLRVILRAAQLIDKQSSQKPS